MNWDVTLYLWKYHWVADWGYDYIKNVVRTQDRQRTILRWSTCAGVQEKAAQRGNKVKKSYIWSAGANIFTPQFTGLPLTLCWLVFWCQPFHLTTENQWVSRFAKLFHGLFIEYIRWMTCNKKGLMNRWTQFYSMHRMQIYRLELTLTADI